MPERKSTRARMRAKLAQPGSTAVVEVGLGNVLFLEGELTSGERVTQLEAAVGPQPRARPRRRSPPPGERVGSSWWQAIVPIAPGPHERSYTRMARQLWNAVALYARR